MNKWLNSSVFVLSWMILTGCSKNSNLLSQPQNASQSAESSTSITQISWASPALQLQIKVLLEGPYDSSSGLMKDQLRSAGLVPLHEPYTALGYNFAGGGLESIDASILSVSGSKAVIDWILVEIRDHNTPSSILASRSALLLADGSVVDLDGVSAVSVQGLEFGQFLVSVRHRNHLGVMITSPISFIDQNPVVVDLINIPQNALYGIQPTLQAGGKQLLWAGDVTFDGQIKYTGSNNDRDPILVLIGGVMLNNVVSGYFQEDVNLDSHAKYTGSDNDRDIVYRNRPQSSVPTNVRFAQLP